MAIKTSTLSPRLVIKGAAQALEFYREVFGAELTDRFDDQDGGIVHAGLRIGESTFSITEQSERWGSRGPLSLGGSPVVLEVTCATDAVWAKAMAAGATEVFPLADHFYGARAGRFADPFGHLWIVTQAIEDVSDDEVRRRMAAWESENAG